MMVGLFYLYTRSFFDTFEFLCTGGARRAYRREKGARKGHAGGDLAIPCQG